MLSNEERLVLARELQADLLTLYGTPILNMSQLQRALNYKSVAAVKQAIQRRTFPIETFILPNRRNRFALAKDVAIFLAEQAFKKGE